MSLRSLSFLLRCTHFPALKLNRPHSNSAYLCHLLSSGPIQPQVNSFLPVNLNLPSTVSSLHQSPVKRECCAFFVDTPRSRVESRPQTLAAVPCACYCCDHRRSETRARVSSLATNAGSKPPPSPLPQLADIIACSLRVYYILKLAVGPQPDIALKPTAVPTMNSS